MFDIRDFCARVDQEPPDILDNCRREGLVSQHAKTVRDLSPGEHYEYKRAVNAQMELYLKNWKEHLQKYMPYDKPLLVNADKRS